MAMRPKVGTREGSGVGHGDAEHVFLQGHARVVARDAEVVGVPDAAERRPADPRLVDDHPHRLHADGSAQGAVGVDDEGRGGFPADLDRGIGKHQARLQPFDVPAEPAHAVRRDAHRVRGNQHVGRDTGVLPAHPVVPEDLPAELLQRRSLDADSGCLAHSPAPPGNSSAAALPVSRPGPRGLSRANCSLTPGIGAHYTAREERRPLIPSRPRTASSLTVSPGKPLPFGANPGGKGTQFAVFSRHATAVSLLLFDHPQALTPVRGDPPRPRDPTGRATSGTSQVDGAGPGALLPVPRGRALGAGAGATGSTRTSSCSTPT